MDLIQKDQRDFSYKKDWSNNDNIIFNELLTLDIAFEAAIESGLATGCDIDLIINYIDKAGSIFDVGAGYGRALNQIICRGYTGKLYAIERANNLYRFLHNQLWRKVNAFHNDIKEIQLDQRFDLILCLWATFADFTPEEQNLVMRQFAKWIKPQGVIVIDNMLPSTQVLVGEQVDARTNLGELTLNGQILQCYGYFPTVKDMFNYAKQAKLKLIKQLNYQTTTGRAHTLYILSP